MLQNGPLETDPLAHNRVQKPDHFGLGVSRAEDDEQLLLLYFMEMLAVDPRRKINLQQFQKQIERFAYGQSLKTGIKIAYTLQIMRQHIFVAQGDIIVEKGQVEVTSGPDDRTHIKR